MTVPKIRPGALDPAVAASTYVPNAIADAAGDLIVADNADSVVRKALGTDDYVLTVAAEGSGAAKVAWESPASNPLLTAAFGALLAGGWPAPPLVAGTTNYYGLNGTVSSQALTEAEELVGYVFIATRAATLDRLGCNITTTAGSAGSVMRLGLRSFNLATGTPGNLVADGGTVSAETTGAKEVAINAALTQGSAYCVTVTVQGGAGTKPVLTSMPGPWMQPPHDAPGTSVYSWTKSSVTGALDNAGSWTRSARLWPRMFVRASA